MIARPRFLLAICRNMRWTDGGVFTSEREAAIVAAQGTGDTQVIRLQVGDDPQAVLASLKRALVIARHQGPDRRLLLVGFGFELHSNPVLTTYRRPVFRLTVDPHMVVKFPTVPEARACLEEVKPFVSDAFIRVMDWRET